MPDIQASELKQLETYLEQLFKTSGFSVKIREKAKDSAEVSLNGEFIGVVYKDTDEGETSFDLNMAILAEDLPEAA